MRERAAREYLPFAVFCVREQKGCNPLAAFDIASSTGSAFAPLLGEGIARRAIKEVIGKELGRGLRCGGLAVEQHGGLIGDESRKRQIMRCHDDRYACTCLLLNRFRYLTFCLRVETFREFVEQQQRRLREQ